MNSDGSKVWWDSKTMWAGLIAFAAGLLQEATGTEVFSAGEQAGALGLLMMVLRRFTGEGVSVRRR